MSAAYRWPALSGENARDELHAPRRETALALTREEVLHVAKLARIGLTEEDVVKFQGQLSQILEHFDVLNQVDTEGVEPTTHTLPLEGIARPDDPEPSLSQE